MVDLVLLHLPNSPPVDIFLSCNEKSLGNLVSLKEPLGSLVLLVLGAWVCYPLMILTSSELGLVS
jgi:hypothetical protein